MKVIGLYNTLIISCPHCGKESKFHVEMVPDNLEGVQIPPKAEKPRTDEPGAKLGDSKEKLHYVLSVLKAHEGEPNRNQVTDFLRAAGAIRPEQEPENWPVRLLPYRKPSHLRDLGLAIANFAAGEKACFPYPPNEPLGVAQGSKLPQVGSAPDNVRSSMQHPVYSKPAATPWRGVSLHLSKLKGTALGQLPQDVLLDLWATFRASKCNGTNGETIDFPADRKLRDALNAAGEELNFKKEL